MDASKTICAAIGAHVLLEFDYHGEHRIVAPYCHGFSTRGVEVLRAVQLRRVNSASKSGGYGFGKLWRLAEMKNVRVLSVARFAVGHAIETELLHEPVLAAFDSRGPRVPSAPPQPIRANVAKNQFY